MAANFCPEEKKKGGRGELLSDQSQSKLERKKKEKKKSKVL